MPAIKLKHGPSKKNWKYQTFAKAKLDIMEDAIVRMMTHKEIREKYTPLIANPTSERTFQSLMIQHGISAAMRKVRNTKEQIELRAKAKLRQSGVRLNIKNAVKRKLTKKIENQIMTTQAPDIIAEKVVQRIQKGADEHFNRIEAGLNKAHAVIEKIEPKAKEIQTYLCTLSQYDSLGRKLYKVDDLKPLTPHQLQVTILTNMNVESLPEEDEAIEV